MKKCLWQVGLGWLVGMAVQAAMPGQHAAGWLMASALSLGGALGGEAMAAWLLPRDFMTVGGACLAGMGAVASLLAEAVFWG